MDVASLVVILSCVGQSADGRYGGYGAGSPTSAPPAYAPPSGAPATSPYSATPGYPPVPSDPIFTAAAPKKTTPPPSNTETPKAKSPVAASSSAVATPMPTKSPATNTTPAATTTDKSAAGELIREAVVVPQSLSVAGRATSLYETLMGSSGDRRRQLDAVRSYWKLSAELAEYHFAWQQTQFLEHLQKVTKGRSGEPASTAAEIAARLASARAQLRESELRLNDAQTQLGDVAWSAGGAARPLPVDVPHVGTYHTQFERIFAGRAPTARAHSLNRTLPLRKDVVDARADGVWAAQDAYEATFEAYQKNQLPTEDVLTALDDFRQRRSDFIAAVRRYNDEIAEYAMLSAPAGLGVETLVGMLIKNPSRPAGLSDATLDFDDGLVPASYTAPTSDFAPTPDPVSAQVAPTLAPTAPSPVTPTAATVVPTPTIPRNDLPSMPTPTTPAAMPYPLPSSPAPPAAFVPPTDAAPLGQMPTLAPPPVTPSPTSASGNPLRGQPTLAPPLMPTPSDAATPRYQANKIPLESSAIDAWTPEYDSAVVPVGYYAQLASLPPAERAQDLVETLYSAPDKNAAQAKGATLAECLARVGSFEQPHVAAAYWNAAEQAARHAAWSKALERLEALSQAVLRMGESPMKTAAMLRVRSARLAAEAERTAARAALEAGRAELTEAVAGSLTEAWLTPITAPHGGGYKTKIEALPASLSNSSTVRETAHRIDVLHDAIVWRAEAVVAGDAAADALLDDFARGRATVHTVIAALSRQADETDALLASTTRYNRSIADYAVAVLPAGTQRETLIGALVVERSLVAGRP